MSTMTSICGAPARVRSLGRFQVDDLRLFPRQVASDLLKSLSDS